MRILFVVHQFYPEYAGGTEKVCYQLAKAAQRAGHFVRVLTCRVLEWPEGAREQLIDSVYHGIPVSAFHRLSIAHDADIDLPVDAQLSSSIVQLLEQEQYDVAHVMHPMRMGSALDAIAAVQLPYVLTITDFFFQCYRINMVNTGQNLCSGAEAGENCVRSCKVASWSSDALRSRHISFRQVLSQAAERVCPSEYVREIFQNEFSDLRFRVIEHGIDLSLAMLKTRENGNEEKAKPLTLGFLGSFVPEKGIECLIEAFAEVSSEAVRLVLHGGFYGMDHYEKKIRALVDGDTRIYLAPFVQTEALFSVLRGFDVLCLPSIVPETFSLVLREAAAAGTPALVSDLGAPAQYVAQNQCGGVIKAGDSAQWAEVINQLLDNSDPLAVWQSNLPLPYRIEEEAFFYQSLYQKAILQWVEFK